MQSDLWFNPHLGPYTASVDSSTSANSRRSLAARISYLPTFIGGWVLLKFAIGWQPAAHEHLPSLAVCSAGPP